MHIRPLQHVDSYCRRMPGSKSQANRALVLAALSRRACRLTGLTPADDVVLMVEGLRRLGFGPSWNDERTEVAFVDREGLPPVADPDRRIDCGLAGTTFRFLCAVSALVPGRTTLTGTERMLERPIAPLVEALRALGAVVECDEGVPPVTIEGGAELGNSVEIDASVSSQFVSALLLIAPLLPNGLELRLVGRDRVSAPYVDLTIDTLARCGVAVERSGDTIRVPRTELAPPSVWPIEGDWSAAGAFIVKAMVTGTSFTAENLRIDSRQGDRALAEILCRHQDDDRPIDLRDVPDQAMNVAVWALFRPGPTTLTGLSTLRGKESDRIAATAAMLEAVGGRVSIDGDDLRIEGCVPLHFGRIDTRGDHRLAIAGTMLGLLAHGVELSDADCVSKSDPGFFDAIAEVHRHQRPVLLCGLRGVGKSTTGQRLAEALGWRWVDTDLEFESQHGPIASFVDEHGWQRFRELEAGVAEGACRPRTVVALGGGTLESTFFDWLVADRERATVVWLQETLETLEDRIRGSNRPSLTGRPITDELAELHARRAPRFAQIASIVCEPGRSVDERVEQIRSGLAPWRSTD